MLGPLNKTLPPLGKSKSSLITVSNFTQSLGAELLVNPGSPYAFTGDDPTSWTVTGESGSDPMVTQVASGGGAGTGAIRFVSSATNNLPNIRQANIIPAGIVQMGVTVSNVASGLLGIQVGATIVQDNIAATRRSLRRVAALSQFVLLPRNAPTNLTVDHTTARLLSVNVPIAAFADGQYDIYFPVPSVTLPGDEINLIFRMSNGANQELVNCWSSQLLRNDVNNNWNLGLNRYSSGVLNNHTTGINVGNTVNGIRVRCQGNNIQQYTLVDGVETQRGNTVTTALLATNININVVYTSAFAPTLLAYRAL